MIHAGGALDFAANQKALALHLVLCDTSDDTDVLEQSTFGACKTGNLSAA